MDISQFNFVNFIGKGSFGEVYKAYVSLLIKFLNHLELR